MSIEPMSVISMDQRTISSYQSDLHISLREHHRAINRAHQYQNGTILGAPRDQHDLKPDEIEYLINMLKEDGMALKGCYKQTPKMCIAAVEQNGLALQYVKIHKSRRICIAAVKQNPDALQFVDVITDEIRMIAKGVRICYLDEPRSDTINLEGVIVITGDEPINTDHMMVMTGM